MKLAATALVVLLALAGCLAPPGLEDELPEELEAMAAQVSASGWYSVPVRAGPDAPLTAAWWTIPPGAVHEWAHNDAVDANARVVAVEAAFVLDDVVAPDATAVLTFRHDEGALAADLVAIDVPTSISYGSPFDGGVQPDEHEPGLAPRFLHLAWGDDVDVGQRLGIVVGVRSAEESAGHLLFRVRLGDEGDFGEDEEPTDDPAAFAASLARAVEVPVVAEGAGIFAAQRLEFTGGLVMPYEVVLTAGDVVVEGGRTPEGAPVTTGRASRVTATQPGDAGWGVGTLLYSSDVAIGEWSGVIEMRDERAEAGGPVRNVLFGPFWEIGLVSALGDGIGPAATTLEVATDGVPQSEMLVLLHEGIGTPVSTLLGEPAHTDSYSSGSSGALREDATGWTLSVHGTRVLLPALPQP